MRARPPMIAFLPGPRPLGAVSRVGVALLAGLFLVAQIAIAVHAATVVHAVCPEHGELVHVDGGHGDDEASHADAAHGPGVEQGSSAADEHLHDVCALCATQRLSIELSPPFVLRWRAALVERAQAPPAPAFDVPAVARYLIAPKHSPPA